MLDNQQVTPERRAEWLRERASRIGASEIASCIGLNKYDSQLRIWLTKTGKLPPQEANQAMEIGTALEPAILELYQRRMKKEIVRTQIFFVSSEHNYLCATLDGITADGINVQAKNVGCASAAFWGPDGTDEIPHNVLLQVNQEMLCAGMELTHVVALIGGNELRVYPVKRDKKIIGSIIRLGAQFMERVRTKTYPQPDQKNDHELMTYLFPGCEGTTTFNEAQTLSVHEWEGARERIKGLESIEKQYKTEILMALGEASVAILTDGRTLYRTVTQMAASTHQVRAHTRTLLSVREEK